MANASSPPAAPGHDQSPREEKVSMAQPAAAAVEMEDLSAAQPKPANPGSEDSDKKDSKDNSDQPSVPVPDQDPSPEASSSSPPPKDGAPTSGDQDMTIDPVDGGDSAGPAVDVMLLLTTGARHPFRIDEKYLTKRNVNVTAKSEDGHMDPFSITVYTLKELILRDWRKEWDQPPREPSAIRLIHFGRMLEDRMALNHYQFSSASRNVIHMTVKPQEIIDEEEAAKKVKDSGSERHRGGCCVIL